MTETKSDAPKHSILLDIHVPESVLENWQVTADLLAEIAGIPAALIMRVYAHEIEVFVSSNSPGNIYHVGDKSPFDIGLYCEKVISTKRKLVVPNALKDPEWIGSPDSKLGMISYCGLPLIWPTGEIFGTICMLDKKENGYSEKAFHLMERFRDSIQLSLESIHEASVARKQRDDAQGALHYSESRFRRLVDLAPIPLCYVSQGKIIKYFNERFARVFGYTPEDIPTLDEWWQCAYPDPTYRAWVNATWELAVTNAAAKSEDIRPMEYQVTCKNGEVRTVEISGVTLGDDFLATFIDISERKQAEAISDMQTRKLKSSMLDFIMTIASTVEKRDPYTAGHQRRVAQLATAIARELKLSEAQIESINLAAVVHDLGKIKVPAEILSKPGRLSENEFRIIQEHPETGYDILKSIDFPWPIARIVLQHHERLNGSGYPHQLKDKETLLEAKILAVADTVEAMASHRPYRAALGIDTALNEIEVNKGSLYEPDVVDACISLFRQHNFDFSF